MKGKIAALFLLCSSCLIHHSAYAQTSENTTASGIDNFILRDANRSSFTLRYEDLSLGEIAAYSYNGGVMLPLSQITQALKFPMQINVQDGTAEGTLIHPDQLFALNIATRKVIIQGQEGTFPSNLILRNQQDIYVDAWLLSRFFPVAFNADEASLTLRLSMHPKLDTSDRTLLVNRWTGKSTEAADEKTPPPPIDIITPPPANETAPPPHEETATEPPEEEQPSPPANTAGIISEDNLLVLQPILDDETGDFIEAYDDGTHLFLPLKGLTSFFDFPIGVSASNRKAEGWFITPDRTFSLDLAQNTLTLNGKKTPIPENSVIVDKGDIFIERSVFSAWFPVDFSVEYSKLILHITARETLPFQAQSKRNKLWETATQNKNNSKKAAYEEVESPYELASWPFLDLSLTQNYRSSADEALSTNYSIHSEGDLGYLTTSLFAAGSTASSMVESLRVKAGRQNNKGGLLGPLDATDFSFGDINSLSLPLVAQTSLGRGFAATNRPLNRPLEFDVTNFTGDGLPGWQVELYRNSILLDFQTISGNGRYEFLNVPILFGNNTFRLVFYGPQGQVEEKVERYTIGNALLKKGELNYDVAFDDKGSTVFDVGSVSNTALDGEGFRGSGEVEYGVSNNLSLSVGGAHLPIRTGTHNYLTTGFKTSFWNIFGSGDLAFDQEAGGVAGKLTALTGYKDISIKAEHKMFNDFVSEEESFFSDPHTSETEFDINSFFTLPVISQFSTGFNVLQESFESGAKRTSLRHRLSKSVLGVTATNQFGLIFNDHNKQWGGELDLTGRVDKYLIRLASLYQIAPDAELNQINLSAQRRIGRDINGLFSLSKNLTADELTTLGTTLSWDLGEYQLGTTVEANDNNDLFIGLNLNLSLGKIPGTGKWYSQSNQMAYSGGIAARAFVDNNYNMSYDEGDELIENPSIRVDKRLVEGKNNLAFGTQLNTHMPNEVTLDTKTIEDPLLMPAKEGYSVITRPGHVTPLDFPVFPTSEVDGTVYLINPAGAQDTAANVEVQLLNEKKEVVQTTRSEYDGFYLFQKIIPGNYNIHIPDNELKLYNALMRENVNVDMKKTSDIFSGNDVFLVEGTPNSDVISISSPTAEAAATSEEVTSVVLPSDLQEEPISDNTPTALLPDIAPASGPTTSVEPAPVDTQHYTIQLGAFKTEDSARTAWFNIHTLHSSIIQDQPSYIVAASLPGKGTMQRLQMGDFTDKNAAKSMCDNLTQAGQNCFITEKNS